MKGTKLTTELCTWEMAKDAANRHDMSILRIGDEIADADGTIYQVAHIDAENSCFYFARKFLLPERHVMNEERTNEGGWNESQMAEYLNGEVYESMSPALREAISVHETITSKGGRSHELQTRHDRVFLPTEKNVFGEAVFSAEEEAEQNPRWELFKETKERIRTIGDEYGPAVSWWESSPDVSASAYFCGVHAAGTPRYRSASYANGVLPCFCIGL